MAIISEKLFTSRLILRRVAEADLPLLVEWSRSREACGDFLTPENYDLDQLRQKQQSGALWNDGEKLYLIELKESGEALGMIHFWSSGSREGVRTIALKIADPAQRGRGYGTEAQKFLLIQLFERMGVEAVEMYTDLNNLGQQRCLTRLGFELVESLNYDDNRVSRVGHLYRLGKAAYALAPIFHYHYE